MCLWLVQLLHQSFSGSKINDHKQTQVHLIIQYVHIGKQFEEMCQDLVWKITVDSFAKHQIPWLPLASTALLSMDQACVTYHQHFVHQNLNITLTQTLPKGAFVPALILCWWWRCCVPPSMDFVTVRLQTYTELVTYLLNSLQSASGCIFLLCQTTLRAICPGNASFFNYICIL